MMEPKTKFYATDTTEDAATALALIRPDVEFLIYGYSCRLFDDRDAARAVDEGVYLTPWILKPEIIVDRHDVRNLMTPSADVGRDTIFIDEHATDAELVAERYRGLPEDETDMSALYSEDGRMYIDRCLIVNTVVETAKRVKMDPSSLSLFSSSDGRSGARIAYSYSSSASNTNEQATPQTAQTPQRYVFDLPTSKQLLIMRKTAVFLALQEPLMLAILTGKTATDPTFSFLHVLNPFHGLFLSLLEAERHHPSPSMSLSDWENLLEITPIPVSAKDTLAAAKSTTPVPVETRVRSPSPAFRVPVINPCPSPPPSSDDLQDDNNKTSTTTTATATITPMSMVTANVDSGTDTTTMDRFIALVLRKGEGIIEQATKDAARMPSIAFLLPWNPQHALYQQRLLAAKTKKQQQEEIRPSEVFSPATYAHSLSNPSTRASLAVPPIVNSSSLVMCASTLPISSLAASTTGRTTSDAVPSQTEDSEVKLFISEFNATAPIPTAEDVARERELEAKRKRVRENLERFKRLNAT